MGIAFDDSGDLFVAESGRHHLLLVSPDEAVEVYASQCHGRRFSGPRDLCFTHEGGVLFCDTGPGPDRGSLFHCDLNGEVEQLAGDLASPAGLVLLDDAMTLFVAEQGGGRILSFELEEDGSAGNREVFVELSGGSPGSLLLDSHGMLLVGQEGVGICVVDPDGAVSGNLEVPGGNPTGMTFGGIDFDQLFVSEASGAVYRLQLDEPGQRPFAGTPFGIGSKQPAAAPSHRLISEFSGGDRRGNPVPLSALSRSLRKDPCGRRACRRCRTAGRTASGHAAAP